MERKSRIFRIIPKNQEVSKVSTNSGIYENFRVIRNVQNLLKNKECPENFGKSGSSETSGKSGIFGKLLENQEFLEIPRKSRIFEMSRRFWKSPKLTENQESKSGNFRKFVMCLKFRNVFFFSEVSGNFQILIFRKFPEVQHFSEIYKTYRFFGNFRKFLILQKFH